MYVDMMHWVVLFLNYATWWPFFATISIPNLNSPLKFVYILKREHKLGTFYH